MSRQDGSSAGDLTRSAAAWLDEVHAAERRGEALLAFDRAERALAEHPSDVALRHRAVLALARAGSTEEAARRYEEYGLGTLEWEDVRALGARLVKDEALSATGERRRSLAARSAALYEEAFRRTGGFYPAVNAATLRALAGEAERSRELARHVVALVGGAQDGGYYAAATEAEARLLLGQEQAAAEALERAAALSAGDHGAVATTRRQLRLVCDVTGTDTAVLDALAAPGVVHFSGHRMAGPGGDGRLAEADEEGVAAQMREAVERRRPGYAYGALAAGGDIMWAEALLERGVELQVVLPFDRDEFVRRSVAPSGEGWVARFERCLGAASSVTYATDDALLGDDVLFRYGSELAMGLALLHARRLESEAWQLALWDGSAARAGAGTAVDVATWSAGGRPSITVGCGEGTRPAVPPPPGAAGEERRVVRAILFGDFRGFSRLSDEQLPRFTSVLLGAVARALEAHREAVFHRNTWGDGIYLVMADVDSAARCGLALQAAVAGVDLAAERLPDDLALRLGAHVGPVFAVEDPVVGSRTYMGSHVSRTARIEPVTPAGAVYVTEAFAAALALHGGDDLACDYVGHMPAAKDFGRLRMYRLRRRGG